LIRFKLKFSFMKNFLILFLLAVGALQLRAQTMKWIPIEPGTSLDKCKSASTKVNEYRCYALQYIPAVSGTLTSYTTGFFVSCTSKGSAIARNESCSMTNNVNLIDGCKDTHQTLLNSSGNSGVSGTNKLEAGKPVYLHQVCFTIPWGEEITVMKDETTDLTTSIDLGNNQVITEQPVFITQNIGRPKYDVQMPIALIDFVTRITDTRKTQLDWSVTNTVVKPVSFVIERGVDGENFKPIGEVKVTGHDQDVAVYQYIDVAAVDGLNFYRLKIFDEKGQYEYSPVRIESFAGGNFSVKTWPSPVAEDLFVFINHAAEGGQMELTDSNGKRVAQVPFDAGSSDHKMNVLDFAAGMYNLVVVSGTERKVEKVVIMHQ
jgi:hypothetical protein